MSADAKDIDRGNPGGVRAQQKAVAVDRRARKQAPAAG